MDNDVFLTHIMIVPGEGRLLEMLRYDGDPLTAEQVAQFRTVTAEQWDRYLAMSTAHAEAARESLRAHLEVWRMAREAGKAVDPDMTMTRQEAEEGAAFIASEDRQDYLSLVEIAYRETL